MISGDLKSPQDLLEVFSGIPQTKEGYLNVLSKGLFLSLKLSKSRVLGYFSNYEEKPEKPLNGLVFIISELLSDTEGYFSFEEKTAIKDFVEVNEDIESLIIKSTILRRELDEMLPLIITTNVVFRSELEEYNGKSLFKVVSKGGDVIDNLRRLKKNLEEGKVEVSEIKKIESVEEIGLDYILESVDYKQINLLKILGSLRASDFTGFVQIEGKEREIYTFFKKGEIFGIYPVSVDIFDYLMEFYGDFKASVVKINDEFVDIFAQAFIGKPIISSEGKYVSLGKLFLTLLSLKENGIAKIVSGRSNYIYIFKEGKLFSVKKEKKWEENYRVVFPKTDYVFFYKDIYIWNVNYLFYLFLLNKIRNLILKYEIPEAKEILTQRVAQFPAIYLKNGKVDAVRTLTKREERRLFNILLEVSEIIIGKVGKETFEREIEEEIKPYKDILKILNLSSDVFSEEVQEQA
ncbi:hypothetical protein JCM9492_07140 [Aquifex pyrophilus]